jgi:DNA-binding transcriptional MerR regulator
MASADVAGVYSIGAVATMLGVPVSTLRAWEDRYRLIVPVRSAGGQRLYSRDDVEKLRFILERTETGLQPADAHRLLAERTRQHADNRENDDADSQSARPTVLLAERDPFAADFLDYFLRTEGYSVRIEFDAADVLRRLDEDRPDVLVIDLLISGGAGPELCRTVRDRSTVPILAVSVLDSRDDALNSGVAAFLRKPLDPLQFVSTVRDLLGTSAFLRRARV